MYDYIAKLRAYLIKHKAVSDERRVPLMKNLARSLSLMLMITLILGCGTAWAAANEGTFDVTTSAQFKGALEDPTNYFNNHIKTINIKGSLKVTDSINAVGYNGIYIGGANADTYTDPSTNASMEIRSGNVIAVKKGTDSVLSISNGRLTNNTDPNNIWQRGMDATLSLGGRVLVENDAQFRIESLSYFMNMTGNATGDKGGLTINYTGAIIIKDGGYFTIEDQGEHSGNVIWGANSNGIMVFEKGSHVTVAKGLFYDGDVNVTGGGGGVIGIDEKPGGFSGSAMRAGTYKYDQSKKAFIRISDSVDPGNAGMTPNDNEDDDNQPVDKNIPSAECTAENAVFDSNVRAFVDNHKPTLPSGYAYKGSLSFSLSYSDPTAAATLTIPGIAQSFGIAPGSTNIIARIAKKDGTGTSEVPVTVNSDGSIKFTVEPVGDYFSEATIELAVKGTGGTTTGSGGGSGGCSASVGLIGLVAIGAVFLRRR